MYDRLHSIFSAHRLLLEIEGILFLNPQVLSREEFEDDCPDLNGWFGGDLWAVRGRHFLSFSYSFEENSTKNEFSFRLAPVIQGEKICWEDDTSIVLETKNSGRTWRVSLPKDRDTNFWTEPQRRLVAKHSSLLNKRPCAYGRKDALLIIRTMVYIFAELPKGKPRKKED